MTVTEDVIAALDAIVALGVPPAARNFADKAPERTGFPYTVFDLDVTESPALSGDAKTMYTARLHRVHLWESRADESAELRADVLRTLDGLVLTDGRRLKVQSIVRVPDPNFLFAHRTFTLSHPSKIAR